MQKSYRFISDPGHAWLEVPIDDIPADVLIKISSCSYFHKGKAYLEEDCDAGLFLNTFVETPEFTEVYQENTPIRNYPRFPATMHNQ